MMLYNSKSSTLYISIIIITVRVNIIIDNIIIVIIIIIIIIIINVFLPSPHHPTYSDDLALLSELYHI